MLLLHGGVQFKKSFYYWTSLQSSCVDLDTAIGFYLCLCLSDWVCVCHLLPFLSVSFAAFFICLHYYSHYGAVMCLDLFVDFATM